ncbi:hypothetical protein ScPMuIL_001372 [Solemya velum]
MRELIVLSRSLFVALWISVVFSVVLTEGSVYNSGQNDLGDGVDCAAVLNPSTTLLPTTNGITADHKRYYWQPPTALLPTTNGVTGNHQRHYCQPPTVLLPTTDGITVNHQRYYCQPSTALLSTTNGITANHQRHYCQPPTVLLATTNGITADHKRHYCQPPTALLPTTNGITVNHQGHYCQLPTALLPTTNGVTGNHQRHYCQPPTVLLPITNGITANHQRHYCQPPRALLPTTNGITVNHQRPYCQPPTVLLATTNGITADHKRHYCQPPTALLPTTNGITVNHQGHYWQPPTALLPTTNGVTGNHQRHYCQPPTVLLPITNGITANHQRHYCQPPRALLATTNGHTANHQRHYCQPPTVLLPITNGITVNHQRYYCQPPTVLLPTTDGITVNHQRYYCQPPTALLSTTNGITANHQRYYCRSQTALLSTTNGIIADHKRYYCQPPTALLSTTNGITVNHQRMHYGLGLGVQMSEYYNQSITNSLQQLCGFLPGEYQTYCKLFVDFITPFIIEVISEDDTPDSLCHKLSFCYTQKGHDTCRLFPLPQKTKFGPIQLYCGILTLSIFFQNQLGFKMCDLPGVKEICKIIKNIFSHHDPGVDLDKDKFSTIQTFRGSSWRGKDCDDGNTHRHPGAIPIGNDTEIDSNCNGIYGRDPTTGESYENLFCKDVPQHGIAILGDSLGAHFHIPAEWLTATELSEEIFENLPFVLENEFDWPELSSSTGYMNTSYPQIIHGVTDSVYLRARQRNHCIHRDFQNIAVNGLEPMNLEKHSENLSRNKIRDQPLLLIYSLVGNDVCSGRADPWNHMTTPSEMRANALQTLEFLNKVLPNGSHVVLTGLVDGRVLYDNLHNRIHPIGSYNKDVTYADFYTYFNCLQISPCTSWLTTNETLRNLTTKRANELGEALRRVAESKHKYYENFDVVYVDCPVMKIFDIWKKQGGQAWELVEPVDGFHTNQIGQALAAKVYWDILQKQFPDFISPVNPNNDKIKAIFGDQGGYL